MSPVPQSLVTLDLEGVLTPEIWLAVADATGLDAFRRTTRDEPDYAKLMADRLDALTRNGVTFSDLIEVVDGLEPLDGAVDFLDRLRAAVPVVILSDTFEQLAAPLFAKLGLPLVLCHRLDVRDDMIVGAEVRVANAKRRAVEAHRSLGYRIVAAGDSFNDIEMLQAADRGVLFRTSPTVADRHPDIPAFTGFDELATFLLDATDDAAGRAGTDRPGR